MAIGGQEAEQGAALPRQGGRPDLAAHDSHDQPPAELDSRLASQGLLKENPQKPTGPSTAGLPHGKRGVMAKVISCQCGFIGRGETVDAAAAVIEAHMREDHPELVGKVTREDLWPWPRRRSRRGQRALPRGDAMSVIDPPPGRSSTPTGSRPTSSIPAYASSTCAAATRARPCRTPSGPSTMPRHIPGAVFVDWEHDFVDPDDPVPYQLAPPDAFARARRAGRRRRRPGRHLRRLLRDLRRPRRLGVPRLRR